MRIPVAPPGYIGARVQDLSWGEDRKTKAVAVEFRTAASNEPLYVSYRLEPDWVIEDAAGMGHVRFSNLLGFYPWPDPAMADVHNHSHLRNTTPVAGTLTFDGHEVHTQRYVASEVVVDVAFFPNASVSMARPLSAVELPALTSAPYESFRSEILPPNEEYSGYHAQRPGGDFQL
jgi:hypothetical protein